jgi:hypothetical protein
MPDRREKFYMLKLRTTALAAFGMKISEYMPASSHRTFGTLSGGGQAGTNLQVRPGRGHCRGREADLGLTR